MLAVHTWVYVYPLHSILHKFYRYCAYADTGKLLAAILMTIVIINHPHPTWYEHSLAIALFIPHFQIISQIPSGFFTVSAWGIGSFLAAFMWELWTRRLGANSNFLYFQTIVLNIGAIGFIVGLLYLIVEMINKVRNTQQKINLRCKNIIHEVIQELLVGKHKLSGN